jgi:hypothetical protein
MTFKIGTKVRYEAEVPYLSALNGIEGTVVANLPFDTTTIKVTKVADAGTHGYLIGTADSFSTSRLVEVGVEEEVEAFKVGDRVQVNDPESTTHHGLVGIITAVNTVLGNDIVKADIDESCEAFKKLKEWNTDLDGLEWYLKTDTLEKFTEKPKVGGSISYEQVERGQRIRVSYENKGVVNSREGLVGSVTKYKNEFGGKDNWTINVLDEDAERYGGKGTRLNWGSDKQKETIVLLEAAPEVDAVLERLLESKGGTVVRAFENQFLVREPFSDRWRNYSAQKSYTSESLRREAGAEIVFFAEDMEGH